MLVFEGLTPQGRINPDYHGVDDEADRMLRDNGGVKALRVARFAFDLLIHAANR